MRQKRIKTGLAVTECHLHLIDENMRSANANSRNDFVEQAIEHYAACLSAAEHHDHMSGLLSSDLEKLFSKFAKTFSTNQYKLAVQITAMCYILADLYDYDEGWVQERMAQAAEDVKRLDSVPHFGKTLSERRWQHGE